MAEVPTAKFAETARRLAVAARAAGLVAPVFRTPPRTGSAVRTIRRLPGGPVIAVRMRERPFAEVVADMIEGIVIANCLDAATALRVRALLLRTLTDGDARTVTHAPARVA